MEIVKKAHANRTFEVLRGFHYRGRAVQPGETVEIDNAADALGLVQRNQVRPLLPETAVYVCLKDIAIPGSVERHTAKRNERVLLKSEDAVRLILSQSVIPEDPGLWRPFKPKVRNRAKEAAFEKELAMRHKEKVDAILKEAGVKG